MDHIAEDAIRRLVDEYYVKTRDLRARLPGEWGPHLAAMRDSQTGF